MSEFAQKRFLIIAGQPKAGTTSLFDWMAQHPEITPSRLKETRFFLDPDYPLNRPHVFDGKNLGSYAELFPKEHGAVFMEATPDYMYSTGFQEIATALPNAHVVIICREPVARLISAFRYFKQSGLLKTELTFDDWISHQEKQGISATTPVAYRALDHCALDRYLPELRDAFGTRLLEIDFADLTANPLAVSNAVCAHLGISPLQQLTKQAASNKTVSPRWPALTRRFNQIHRSVSQRLLAAPKLRSAFRPAGRAMRSILTSNRSPDAVRPTARTIETISQYLKNETGPSIKDAS